MKVKQCCQQLTNDVIFPAHQAVNGAQAVVGVVGRGHLRGITYALNLLEPSGTSTSSDSRANQYSALRFSDLVGGKNNKAGRRREAAQGLARLAVETVLFAALWSIFSQQ